MASIDVTNDRYIKYYNKAGTLLGSKTNICEIHGLRAEPYSNITISAYGTATVTGTSTPSQYHWFAYNLLGTVTGSYDVYVSSFDSDAVVRGMDTFNWTIYLKNLSSSSVTVGGTFNYVQACFG